ncbi:hypothetical protein DFS33DRAFT_1307753 [Desarmillaria ectypa]|nr:hypothetical protein DFS33DRAFT_1307753 [Desarmillaria ectypa]
MTKRSTVLPGIPWISFVALSRRSCMAPTTHRVYTSPLTKCTSPLVTLGSTKMFNLYANAQDDGFLSVSEGDCVCGIVNFREHAEYRCTVPRDQGC